MLGLFLFTFPILLFSEPNILWFEEFSGSGEESIGHYILTCEDNGFTWFHSDCIEYVYGCVVEADVWGNWDVNLRDLVIVNKEGYEVARLNLTYNNPDPNSTCGENYQTIKDLIIGAR